MLRLGTSLNLLTILGGVPLIALAIAARQHGHGTTGFGLLLAGCSVLLFAFWRNRRRYSAIDDTPTSRIASAAQGYAELLGRGRQMCGQSVLSPLTHLPCLWYRYTASEYVRGHKGERVLRERERGESEANFLLVDDSGQCVIDPVGAEMHTSRRQRWTQGDWVYEEWLLLAEDRLYALGQFSSVRPTDATRSLRDDLHQTLNEWKANRSELLRRFDTNGDGELDMDEWQRVRQAAEQQVREQHRSEDRQDGYHLLRRPADGRPFIIANQDPQKLSRRLRLWAHSQLALALCGMLVLVWMVTSGRTG